MGETEFIKKNDAVDCIVFHFLVNIFPSGCMMHRGSGEAYAREIPKKKRCHSGSLSSSDVPASHGTQIKAPS